MPSVAHKQPREERGGIRSHKKYTENIVKKDIVHQILHGEQAS
jgi:hypothetical protein